ncbi:hypothetical protein [Kocuria palustris]|uniref:hypothetical protein n=1 Tax=Kocuria palustris TaxID=71999 RepID=UPI0020448119|nr:hypothetical protein [Kocuria palustris]MCM3330529.1 hypothetical protein [Kocuria palustris]
MLRVVVVDSPEYAGRLAGDAVAAVVAGAQRPVMGLATGSSPRPVYDELARRVDGGSLSLARTRAFLLDEYLGLLSDDPRSYRAEIEREVVECTDLPSAAVRGLDGAASAQIHRPASGRLR